MSRLYLSILFSCLFISIFSQTEIGKYIQVADEKIAQGDYYYALELYDKALAIDSNSVDLLWKYAEALRAYKDYRKAELYYAIVFEREEAGIFPESILNLGLMQKNNGHYDEAMVSFKKAIRKYSRHKKDYLYLKARREYESCAWAKSNELDNSGLSFDPLPETINTSNSEFGHTIHDGKFIFSSLRSDSINQFEEVYDTVYKTELYSSTLSKNVFEQNIKIEALSESGENTGNGSFSLDGQRFYFSQCTENGANYRCKIMVAKYLDGNWTDLDSLGEIINEIGANTTMPCIAELDGKEVLLFASDRNGTIGGLDLWYSTIKNGNQYSKVLPLTKANSPDNDITPWWDMVSKNVYFSSSWENGYGGYDVFSMHYTDDFQDPVNIGLPINSSANDLYYFRDGDSAYVTSNRIGVLYSKNPTCCSDIFIAYKPESSVQPTDSLIVVQKFPNQKESLSQLNNRLPVTLYFHNDVPSPRSWDTTTQVNYMDSYVAYGAMLQTYQKEYSAGLADEKAEDAMEDISLFFSEYADQGVSDLNLFRDLLLEELKKGSRIKVTVKGFASPLAKSDYNVNLTKRRIVSLINYLGSYEAGVFKPYLDATASNGGELMFIEIPFGEYTSSKLTSDNLQDQQNSVYSRAAALERKIEIQSVSFIADRTIDFALSAKSQIQDAGKVKMGELIEREFILTNTSDTSLEFDYTNVPCDCTTAELEKTKLEPGESTKLKMVIKTDGYSGPFVKSVSVKVKNVVGEYRLIISAEIIP
jgi:tetratricopeptide (TPR) repeat protein